MPAALWLASFPDGGERCRGEARMRKRLCPAPWFRELLCGHGGEGFDSKVLYNLGARAAGSNRSVTIHALLCLDTLGCTHNDGVLTPWHREAQLLREYHAWPRDDYEVQVAGVFPCAQEMCMELKKTRTAGHGGVGRISFTHPLFVAQWGGSAGDTALQRGAPNARLQLERLGLDGPEDPRADDMPVLAVPFPIAFLILHGSWSRLLLRTQWHRSFRNHRDRVCEGPLQNWPPQGAAAWRHAGENENKAGPSEYVLEKCPRAPPPRLIIGCVRETFA